MQSQLAAWLASHFHDGQLYGEKRYFIHLYQVYKSVEGAGGDDEQQAIAWLHDVIEDTSCTYATLLDAGCSLRVIAAVECLTKVKDESYEDYISKVKSNKDSTFVKKHDTLCNLTQSLKEGNSKRIKKYAKQLLLLEE